ncbi:zinc finger, CCHC-type containing protein, partial [Tanacetum coccineum]
IVLRDDEAVNVESLSTKYPIVDWKTHIIAKDKMYYQIIRADRSEKYYNIFSVMLDDFNRQDVLDLYRLVAEALPDVRVTAIDRLWSNHNLILLQSIEVKIEAGSANDDDYDSRIKLLQEVDILDTCESFYLFQKARVKWDIKGVHYKIIAKILANRLSKVIDKIVSHEQSAFIVGRQILDAPLIHSEIVERACLSLSRASVLVNGSHILELSIKRELRQGDLLMRIPIELPVGNNVVPLRSDTIRLVQNGCSFHGLRSEDPNQHLKDFLKLVDSLDLDGENRERTRLCLFQFSLRDQASNWLERLPAGSITYRDDLYYFLTHFLAQFFPPGRTAKLRNDILMFQQHHGESLSEAWTRFKDLLQKFPHHGIDHWLQIVDRATGGKLHDKNLALYDHEGWNDTKEFVKPVKAISTPQSTSKTPDRRLLELEDQINFLLKDRDQLPGA